MWIDTHCHPFAKAFDGEQNEVFDRARKAGVTQFIVVGFDKDSNPKALEIAEIREDCLATLGVHPCDCSDLDEDYLAWIRSEASSNDKVVAIGEMGLDYHHMKFSKEEQAECFRQQIRLANELDLPCIVHSRDAAEDTLKILLEEKAKKVVFHCYSYGLEFGKKVWEQGYYTSFSGVLTYKNAKDIQEAAKHAPDDLILVETDCPYLAPQSIRGKRNEMAYVSEIGEFLAELRGVKPQQLASVLAENYSRFF